MLMILIGQYDSPFVRRVAIALAIYGFAFEHRPWSTFGDSDRIAPYNPLRRVPTLVPEDGTTLIESGAILDYLDEIAGPGKALIPQNGPLRRQALKICALATGLNDKAVSLVYERVLHRELSTTWVERCEAQVTAALEALEADRRARYHSYWFGDTIFHSDIAVACSIRFLRETHPKLFSERHWPALKAHADRCEALPAFKSVLQPFLPPN
jgi:glutathione S-transferase